MKNILRLLAVILVLLQLIGCRIANPDLSTEGLRNETSEKAENDVDLYADILADYEKLVEIRLSETFEEKWNSSIGIEISDALLLAKNDKSEERATYGHSLEGKWSDMLVGMIAGLETPQKSSFMYMEKDINGDDLPELFWVREDGTVLAIFTVRDGHPVMLDAFGPRYECIITNKGEVYTLAAGGVGNESYDIRYLTTEGILVSIKSFGLESGAYYEVVNGEKISIAEDRFDALLEEHPFVGG